MTDAEAKLWNRLRNGQLLGLKFRRQVPIGSFIADFCCRNPKFVVEVDGSQHSQLATQDASRTRVLAEHGYTVVRFWDNEVLQDIDAVLEAIVGEVMRRTLAPSRSPLPRGKDARERTDCSLSPPAPPILRPYATATG
jgi:very-short-patch-repair endonuclease